MKDSRSSKVAFLPDGAKEAELQKYCYFNLDPPSRFYLNVHHENKRTFKLDLCGKPQEYLNSLAI